MYSGGGNRRGNSSNSFPDMASKVNSTSNIVGTVADISQAAGYNATIGVWGDLSKIRYYSSGWSGSNQYVWETFGIAKGIGFGAMGISVLSDFSQSLYIDPQTGKPFQSWGETGLNTSVTGISYLAGSKVGGTNGVALSVVIQLDYSFAKIYFKALQEHPDWVTYKYRPR